MFRRPSLASAFAAALLVLVLLPACAALELMSAAYRPDLMLPQWNYFFSNKYKPGDVIPDRYQGGSICIYLRNTGSEPVAIGDFTINGTGLATGIGTDTTKDLRCGIFPSSVYFPEKRQGLIDAGEPVWWRVEPNPIPAGATAEVFVRMRHTVAGTLACSIKPNGSAAIPVSIAVSGKEVPRVVDYYLSPDMTKLYLYLRHTVKGKAPKAVYVDGTDVTSTCTIISDPSVDVVTAKCDLPAALERGSYHVFQASYDDGSKAIFGLRTYSDDFKYGTWGAPKLATEQEKHDFLVSLGQRSINLLTEGQRDLGSYIESPAGKAIMDQYGIRKLHDEKTSDRLWGIYCCDEPDAGESKVSSKVAPVEKVGTLAQSMVEKIRDNFRGEYARYPCVVNLDSTYTPYNWYNWAHVPDIFSLDPYYMARMSDSYWYSPNTIPFYEKATYIYAFSSTGKAACEPRPLHIILQCTKRQRPDENHFFRWPTPEEQHISAYFAIAAGAKQINYWWLAQLGPQQKGDNGCAGSKDPVAVALWREMGLIGAELRLMGDVIVNSTPASFPIESSEKVWVKPLVSELDTVVLVCANDDYKNNDKGTTIQPVKNAKVKVQLPSWLGNEAEAFQVDYKGVRDIPAASADGKMSLDLGTLDLTRMVVITKNATLRSVLQSQYASVYAPRVSALTSP